MTRLKQLPEQHLLKPLSETTKSSSVKRKTEAGTSTKFPWWGFVVSELSRFPLRSSRPCGSIPSGESACFRCVPFVLVPASVFLFTEDDLVTMGKRA
jgi:hypothetical protein